MNIYNCHFFLSHIVLEIFSEITSGKVIGYHYYYLIKKTVRDALDLFVSVAVFKHFAT